MNKRTHDKIMKHKALEHSSMAEAAAQLSARELAEKTVAKAVDEVKTHALALEAKAEKLLEKVPLIGETASQKLHALTEKASAAIERATT